MSLAESAADYEYINGLIEARKYDELGELGVILKAFDAVGIPHDTMTANEMNGKLIDISILIPPNEHEHEISIFLFTPEFKFDRVYVENAHPLSYFLGDDDAADVGYDMEDE